MPEEPAALNSQRPTGDFRRYAEIYWLMIRNSLIREMNFKANFMLWMVVEFLWFVGQIVFLEVLFAHTESIGGWSKWECVMLVGTHQITAQCTPASHDAR